MACVVGVFRTDDYEGWKRMFDADPAGRKQAAKGHRIMRSVDEAGRSASVCSSPTCSTSSRS